MRLHAGENKHEQRKYRVPNTGPQPKLKAVIALQLTDNSNRCEYDYPN